MSSRTVSWRGLVFDNTDPQVYPVKPASLLLAEVAVAVVQPEQKMLDMCTGSGVVAIAVAKLVPNTVVQASDLNPEARRVAMQNAVRNGAGIPMGDGNLFEWFSRCKFDVITIHPPAVPYPPPPHSGWGMTWGMHMATNGGPDGSSFISRCIVEARWYLKDGGRLLLLLPHWSNTKKAWGLLRENYGTVSELDRRRVEFFPAIESTPDDETMQYVRQLASEGVIEINFDGKKPTSTVSVIQASNPKIRR